MSQFKIKGVQGELEVFESKLTITPKGVLGFLNHGVKGEKTIPFRSITAIQLKKAGLTSGYIQFSVVGGNESRGGILKAAQDENTFMYASANDNATIETIKNFIEDRLGSGQPSAVARADISIADELAKLADMRTQGVLTEEEFAKAKARLMKSVPPGLALGRGPTDEPVHAAATTASYGAARAVAAASPHDGVAEKGNTKKGGAGKWIALVLFVLVIATNLPWIGLLIGVAFVGLAGGVLAKKLRRSAFSVIAKAQDSEMGRVTKLAGFEAAFGVLVMLMSAGSLSSAAERAATAKTEAAAAAEKAEQLRVAQQAKRAALRKSLPEAIAAAVSSLSIIDQQITSGDFDAAHDSIFKSMNGLSTYELLQSESAELRASLAQLATRRQQVGVVLDSRKSGQQATAAAEAGDSQVKARAYLEADNSYQAALSFLEKIDSTQREQAGVDALRLSVEKRRQRIAPELDRARAAAAQAAAKAAAISKAEEARKARQFALGDFYYWIGEAKFANCIGNQFVRECAGPGATFIVVPYVMENTGKGTATVLSSDFEVHDASGRAFRPSSRGETALAMSEEGKDLVLSELQPGVQKNMSVVFEVPKSAEDLKLVVPKKGLLAVSRKVIPL